MKSFFLTIIICALVGTFLGTNFFGRTLSESMMPTMLVGDISFINRFEKPVVGDVIAFSCKTPRCGVEPGEGLIHRLKSVEPNGCMHIEGDNQPIAIDTIDYGCLMPSDISIVGVEHPLTWFNNLFNR
jgi:signal peptidase I